MRKSLLIKKGVACLLSASMVLSTPFVGGAKTASADDASQTPDITTGLVGHYTFEDSLANSASGAAESAAAKVHGGAGDTWNAEITDTGSYADGMHGKAFSFPGGANNIAGNNGLQLDVTLDDNYTVSAWVKTEEKINSQSIFFSSKTFDDYFNVGTNFNNACSGALVMKGGWYNADTNPTAVNTWIDKFGTYDIKINEWTYVTFKMTADGKAALYYDGEKVSEKETQTGSEIFKGQEIFLGINFWDASFKGLMDDVRVYNRALTDEEVVALYKEDSISVTSATITGENTVSAKKIYATQEDIDSNAAAGSFESGTLKLSSSFEPANATEVTTKWSVAEADSAKAAIAEDGTVTLKEAVNDGDTIKIIATLTDAKGNKVTAEKTITVSVEKVLQTTKVDTIQIADMSIATEYVNINGSITNAHAPVVTYEPADAQIKNITYTVKSGEDIVSVDGEKIVSLKAGEATITAVSKSNADAVAEFKVTVTEAARPNDSFTAAGWSTEPGSGYEKLVGNFDITYSFKNEAVGTNAWDNFVFHITDEKGKYLALRADRFGFDNVAPLGVSGFLFKTLEWDEEPNWTNFATDMKNANVTVHAVRQGDVLTVDYDITASATENNYKMKATATGKDVPETLFAHITGDASVKISNLTLTSNILLTGEHFTAETKSVANNVAVGSELSFKLPADLTIAEGYKLVAVKYAGEKLTADAEGNYKAAYHYTKGISSVKLETAIPYHIAVEGLTTFQYGTIDAVDTAKDYLAGDEITIVATPNAGYTSNITVTYMDGTEKKSVELTKTTGEGGKEIIKFKMPAANVTITYAEFTGITRDAIQAAIAAAKPVVDAGNESGKYTAATWNAFKTAYDAAVAAEANASATQADLDTAQKALDAAQKALAFSYKVELSDKEISLTVGDKKKLTATVTTEATDKNVKWASTDAKIATVSDGGEVTAVAAGDTTITATAADGTSASCKVTVKAAGGSENPGGNDNPGGNINPTDTETLTGTAWWTGNQTGKDYELKGDGTIKLNVEVAEAYNNETAFNAELVGVDAAGTKYFLTTGSLQDAWNAEGSKDVGTITINKGTPTALVVGHTYSITVTRTGQDFTVKYYDETAKEDYCEFVWTNSNMPETVNLHIIAQLGTFKVSKASDGTENPGGNDTPGGDDVKASLTLNKSKATLYTGKASNKVTVKATVTGESKTVTWKSSKPKVAKVSKSSGGTITITAVGKGSATITATANGIKKTVKITVKNPTITVKNGKKKVASSLNVKKKKAVKLTITTNPKKAGVSLAKLGKKDKKVLTASLKSGKLTIKGKKKGTVTLSIKSGKAVKKIKVKVK